MPPEMKVQRQTRLSEGARVCLMWSTRIRSFDSLRPNSISDVAVALGAVCLCARLQIDGNGITLIGKQRETASSWTDEGGYLLLDESLYPLG